MKILKRSFYARNTVKVAKELIGKIIIREYNHQQLSGMIVETEAYTSEDPASHAFIGKTERNKALFGPVGHAYIYFTYGNHYCLNLVARDQKVQAGGVLIRALEPINGIEIMQKNRKQETITALMSGPGKLTQAMRIDKKLYGHDVTQKGILYIVDSIIKHPIIETKRIGISKAQDIHWRFYLKDSLFVSKK